MRSVLIVVIVFLLELVLPFPIQFLFHGIPVLIGVTNRKGGKYPIVFILSLAQVLIFKDTQYAVPFDLMSTWVASLPLHFKFFSSNMFLKSLAIFMALFVSSIPQFSRFNTIFVVSSMMLWYLICASTLLRRNDT